MSRTDKDTPWWVSAEWWTPQHWRCDRAHETPGNAWHRIVVERTCDLPAEPVVERPGQMLRVRRCRWAPARLRRRDYWQGGVPHWFVDHIWNSPTRAQLRDDCRQAVKEYRATGGVDVMPPVDQHRQCAGWLYW